MKHADFLHKEMAEFIENRFWVVLPYHALKHLPNLQLSPAAVKEEQDRKPRLLCDHSWYPINNLTSPHAPPEAMQFGGTMQRILRQVRHTQPHHGPVYMSKHDVKDRYYCLSLRPDDCPHLAIILPTYNGEEQLITILLACTMRWVESPLSFCTMSETAADNTNHQTTLTNNTTAPRCLEGLVSMSMALT